MTEDVQAVSICRVDDDKTGPSAIDWALGTADEPL
jgi:hypothetical protein